MVIELLSILGTTVSRALSFRIRGGGWFKFPSTQLARLFDAAVIALGFYALTLDWQNALCVLVLSFCSSLVGWFNSIDLGTNEGTFIKDFIKITLRGLFMTLPVGLWLTFGYLVTGLAQYPLMWLYGLSGLLAGLVYYVAWFHPLLPRWAHLQPGPEQGEFNFGALMGLFFGVSLCYG